MTVARLNGCQRAVCEPCRERCVANMSHAAVCCNVAYTTDSATSGGESLGANGTFDDELQQRNRVAAEIVDSTSSERVGPLPDIGRVVALDGAHVAQGTSLKDLTDLGD